MPFAVDVHRKQGDDVADKSDAGDGQQDVPWRDDDRVGLYHEAAGHGDESEMLLEQRKADADNQSGKKADKRDQPAFQHEDPLDKAFSRTHAQERLYVVLLLDDEHRQATEDVECDNDNDENQDHIDGGLLVFHHLVERFVLLETILDLEVRAEPVGDFLLQFCCLLS